MIEMLAHTEYGRYSQNYGTAGQKDKADVEFSDTLTNSGDSPQRPLIEQRHTVKVMSEGLGNVVDVITYNHGGKVLMLNTTIGAYLDIII
ncbi:hypothetical protein ACFL47_10215 [Candidatus Latescibacterota bacterium]